MKRQFVKTENSKLFRSHIYAAQNRGALEGGLMSVTGRPGEGKTVTLHNWAAEVGAVMLTGAVDWTPHRMMIELAEKLGLETTRGFERKIEEMITRESIPLIVDEAGFALASNAACLEKLRGITDKSYSLLVLAFMDHDLGRLDSPRHKQLSSRIATRCIFSKSTLGDVALAFQQLCEVPVAADLVAHVHTETDARMRLVMNAITRIEAASRARPEEVRATPMTLADVRGKGMFTDFKPAVRSGLRSRLSGGAGA